MGRVLQDQLANTLLALAAAMAKASMPLACVMMVSRELGASCPSALLIALATGNARMVAFALAKRATVASDAAASAAPLTALAMASASTAPASATRASAVSL